tara:strand:- start:268 stop:369 length:102 start_codon:yes stop_codon:yes gene_type:complete
MLITNNKYQSRVGAILKKKPASDAGFLVNYNES